MKKFLYAVAICAAVVMPASAETIRATSGVGPNHILASKGYPALFNKLSELTDGRWDGKDTPSGLLTLAEMNAGLRDGVSDMGALLLPYFVSDYPETSIVMELSMSGKDNRAIASAVTEYIATCSECLAEFKKGGQVFLGSDSTTTYAFLSTKPIRTTDDMKGLRIRTAGSVFTRFVEALGGIPTQMTATEVFEGLSQGVVDGTYSSVAELKNSQLYDAVKYVTEIRKGVFNAAASTDVSKRLWERMTPEDRAHLAHAAQFAQAVVISAYIDTDTEAKTEAKAKGIEFLSPDPSLIDSADAFKASHNANLAATLTERGIQNAQGKIDRYLALIEKWEGIVKDLKSPDELAERRFELIWSKLDYSSYGL